MLSAKARRKNTKYSAAANRSHEIYPFVLLKYDYPAELGNFFYGVPDSVPFQKNSQSGRRETVAHEPANGDSIHEYSHTTYRRSRAPQNRADKATRRYKNPLKHSIGDAPEGMKNQHTQHIRLKMFGANSKLSSAGKGDPSKLSSDAASGRLFHSVITSLWTRTSTIMDLIRMLKRRVGDAGIAMSSLTISLTRKPARNTSYLFGINTCTMWRSDAQIEMRSSFCLVLHKSLALR